MDQELDAKKDESKEVDVQMLMKQQEELMERINQMEATKSRILEESKGYKEKYRTLRSSVEEKQKADLEKTENWKELLDIEKNKNSEMSERLKHFKKQTLQKELNFQVASIAKDAYSTDDIIQSLPRDLIEIDDENLSIKGVEEAVSLIRERKPYLFNHKPMTGMASGRPSNDTNLTADEQNALEEKLWTEAIKGIL